MKMLNPLEMNFYGTRNDGSLAYEEEISVPNETTVVINQESQSNVLEPNKIDNQNQESQSNVLEPDKIVNQDANNDGHIKREGIGKWVDPDKGKRCKTDPYPSPSLRNFPCDEKGLPKSLLELFTPLKCNLCKCIMGSAATAKDHYSGKKHKLNIRKWFLIHPEHREETSSDYHGSQTKIMDPNKLYCKFCDVMLSSEQQVESHYLGKKHKSIVNSGIPKNAQFNPAKRQWERFPKGAAEGRHGIGFGFLEKHVVGKELSPIQKCFCEICMVACPSEITFKEHLTGAKHKKKMAVSNNVEFSSATKDKDVEEVSKRGVNAPGTSDLSIYRTPTGKYYCSTCNVTVNSQAQFVQHSDSKKHKSKAVLSVSQQPNKE